MVVPPLQKRKKRRYPHLKSWHHDCKLNWKNSLWRHNLVRILRPHHLRLSRWALHLMTIVLTRNIEERHTQRVEDFVKMEADVGPMQPQSKEHLQPPNLEAAGKGSSLEPKTQCSSAVSWVQAPGPQNYERVNSHCFMPSSLWKSNKVINGSSMEEVCYM